MEASPSQEASPPPKKRRKKGAPDTLQKKSPDAPPPAAPTPPSHPRRSTRVRRPSARVRESVQSMECEPVLKVSSSRRKKKFVPFWDKNKEDLYHQCPLPVAPDRASSDPNSTGGCSGGKHTGSWFSVRKAMCNASSIPTKSWRELLDVPESKITSRETLKPPKKRSHVKLLKGGKGGEESARQERRARTIKMRLTRAQKKVSQ